MTETKWLDDDEQRLWRSFLLTVSGLPAVLDARLKAETGISHDDYEVLVHLSEAPEGRVRMSDLSSAMLHSRSRLTQRIDRLAGRGWVSREKCSEDARGTWAVLTDAGLQAITEAAPTHVAHVREHLIDHVRPEEQQAIIAVLERLAAELQD